MAKPMTRFALTVAAGVLLTACNGDMPDPDADRTALTAEDRAEIEALSAAYSDHAMAGDWEGLGELFHPDAARMIPGIPGDLEGPEGILEAIEALDSPPADYHEQPVVEVGGTRELAFCRGTYRFEATVEEDGEEVSQEAEGRWLAVVRRDENDAWRFYRMLHYWDQSEPQMRAMRLRSLRPTTGSG